MTVNCLLQYAVLVIIVILFHSAVAICFYTWYMNAWLENTIGSRQLWKLNDDGILENKFYHSNTKWRFKEINNELIYIVKNSTQCLEATNEGKIKENLGKAILGDIEEGNPAQRWKKGAKNTEGYLTLKNCKGHEKFLTASVPRLFSDDYLVYELGAECTYGNVYLPCNFRFYLESKIDDAPSEHCEMCEMIYKILKFALTILKYPDMIVFGPPLLIHYIYENLRFVLSPSTMIEKGGVFFKIPEKFQSFTEDSENKDEQFQKFKEVFKTRQDIKQVFEHGACPCPCFTN